MAVLYPFESCLSSRDETLHVVIYLLQPMFLDSALTEEALSNWLAAKRNTGLYCTTLKDF